MHWRLWITLVGIFFITPGRAQQVENVKIEIIGELVNYNYDLLATSNDSVYTVKFYCIVNGYSHATYHAIGDVGKKISGGKNKLIIWDHRKELSNYDINKMRFKAMVFKKQLKKKTSITSIE